MTRVLSTSILCPNCRRGLHNKYRYLGAGRVELIKPRCKGEDKCECRCLTHFLFNGKLTPIGAVPIRDDILTSAKSVTDEQLQLPGPDE